MSSASTTPPVTTTEETTTTNGKPPAGFFAALAGAAFVAIFSLVFFLAFHIGAGYLSFQKYGSFLWAVLDFIFPYFYYPYYAFFLAKDVPPQTMFGGRRLKRRA
jgi:energy-coupling factor transporter transmembrane protein EcfT